MPVEMREVVSSHVRGIGYDAERQELHVDYRGRRGIYRQVPPDVAEAVMDAPSTGQALHLWVRGTYEFGYLAAAGGIGESPEGVPGGPPKPGALSGTPDSL